MSARRRLRWGSVALGWFVSVLAGIALSPLFRELFAMATRFVPRPDEFTASLVAVSVLSGFLAHLVGGYVAGRTAGCSGGLHGAMTAVLGLVVGLALGFLLDVLGVAFTEEVPVPPASFAFAGGALVGGLVLFIANLFGGYVGGKLGEPSGPGVRRAG